MCVFIFFLRCGVVFLSSINALTRSSPGLMSSSSLLSSSGGHYCWQLWARWTHQEPQRHRYRWVLLFQCSPVLPPDPPPPREGPVQKGQCLRGGVNGPWFDYIWAIGWSSVCWGMNALILLACWTRFIVWKVVQKAVRTERGYGSKVTLTSTKSCNLHNHLRRLAVGTACYNMRILESIKAPFSGFNIGSGTFFDYADDHCRWHLWLFYIFWFWWTFDQEKEAT